MSLMIFNSLFNKTNLPAVMKSLDAGALRSRTISNNIANTTTPGYRRLDVEFESSLKNALDRNRLQGLRTDSQHMPVGKKRLDEIKPRVYRPNDLSMPSGKNNVDIDTEMAKLAENQIKYRYGVKFASGAYKSLNAAIKGQSLR